MKLLFVLEEAATEASSQARALVHSARLEGLTVEVVAPSNLADLEAAIERFMPDAVVVSGVNAMAREVLARARARQIAAVATIADLCVRDPLAFEQADGVLVPSQFAARYYAEALGVRAIVVPSWVEPDRAIAADRDPRYVTFVDPSAENGAYVFARIADELGRLRPDIPLLIVGIRGSGVILAGCGIDVFARGNVHLRERTANPRDHWQITRLALIPSLAWDASPRKLAEALAQGIPSITSDRGALPEFQDGTGASLPIPDRFTPATRTLPTPAEVAPWVEAITRLWDAATASSDSLAPSLLVGEGWGGGTPSVGSPGDRILTKFFQNIYLPANEPHSMAFGGAAPPPTQPSPTRGEGFSRTSSRSRSIVLVPYFNTIERACEQSLRKLEEAGVTVIRSEGCPQIDVARNALASDALNQGAESIFFIDADLGFDPLDALRLLARPEPVISGVYARKRRRAFASVFAPGINEVLFGADSPGPYPLQYAAGGFLRIKAEVLVRMITKLNLPACNAAWGRRDWPFFQPLVASTPDGQNHYLGEDWAFSHRLHQVGITPLADTSIRLWHIGPYGYGWEDAGTESARHPAFRIKIEPDRMSE